MKKKFQVEVFSKYPMKERKKFDSIISVCSGKKCREKGSDVIFETFRKSIKEGNCSGKTLLIKRKCLDHCKNGPIVIKENTLITRFRLKEI
jgi:NADH:ubiquinone oxidoreductase subunit E